ncbi:MAG: UDP-N-acetylglucosamine 1-carboxyvinyltransferase [Patescibacteria group bacterium]
MAKFIVKGHAKLSGKIEIAGNKNSVLPIMAAALLTDQISVLENVPNISDVAVMADLLAQCGVEIINLGNSKISINPSKLKKSDLPRELAEKLRASVVLIAPMVAKLGHIKMGYPGGDIIGRRPLDTHFQALEALGAKIKKEEDYFEVTASALRGAEIFLEEASVTATENAIIAASVADGETVIKRAASEPHIVDLCEFLIKMGAKIEGVGSNVLKITGVKTFYATTHFIRPDHIEAGTFAILAAVTKSKLEMSPVIGEDLEMILLTLKKFGVDCKMDKNTLTVSATKLRAVEKVVTDVWPGFPTDLMAPMIVLATQAEGVTILHDWMYESRMFFVDKLLSMGAKVVIADPHRVFVYGPSSLHGQRLDTPDIRAGIALVIAALAADGKSEIDKAELIERGYENIVERLSTLGAKIQRVN